MLDQNYPNPFNPTTVISYQLPVGNHVILRVYDMTGRELSTLVDEYQTAGKYTITFNAASLPSGVYYYKIISNTFAQTKQMVLLK